MTDLTNPQISINGDIRDVELRPAGELGVLRLWVEIKFAALFIRQVLRACSSDRASMRP